MPIKMINCRIENCHTGIKLTGDVQLDISGTSIVGCKTAIDAQDRPGVLQSLGLPDDTPVNLLRETLELLLTAKDSGPVRSAEVAAKTGLFAWLGAAANTTQILGALISLQQHGYVQAVLNLLPK
jgi:hypothetical protein